MVQEYAVHVYGKRIPWEIPVQLCIKDFLREGQCGFDVGANVGGVAMAMGRMVGPTGQVHAFEANPFLQPRIRGDLAANGASNVTLVPRAVWTQSGTILPFYCDTGYYQAASSLIRKELTTEETLVETIALDDYCASYSLRPQVLKIDVEGAEVGVLKGAQQLLRHVAPVIVFEYCAAVVEDQDPLAFLRPFGYTFYDVNLYKEVNREFYLSHFPVPPIVNVLALPPALAPEYADLAVVRYRELHFPKDTVRTEPIALHEPGRYLVRVEFEGPDQSIPRFQIHSIEGENLAYSQVPLDRYHEHSCSNILFDIDAPTQIICDLGNEEGQVPCSLKLIDICKVEKQVSRVVQSLTADLRERQGTVERLRAQREELQQCVSALAGELADQQSAREILGAQLSESEGRASTRSQNHEEQEHRVVLLSAELEAVAAERKQLEAVREWLRHQLAAQHEERGQTVHGLQVQLWEKDRELERLSLHLNSITGSTGWTLLRSLWRIRHAVAPRGSSRERCGQAGMHLLRRLRSAVRSGPAALALAPARAVYRCLPAPLKHAIKGSSGQAPAVAHLGGQAKADPLVSVVLPVYNQSEFLRDSIQSVLAQTYTNFELILVNDGSTDGVEAVLDEFVGHPKVRILAESNLKLPKALSNGFEFARGTYWTWTSADNEMHPLQLARLVAFLETNPDVAMVYADYEVMDENGAPLRDPCFRAHNRRLPEAPDIHLPHSTGALNTVQDNFIGPCFLYRASAGRLVGEYDPEPGVEDYDYWMRLNTLCRIAHLGTDEVLYRYRWHSNSISGTIGPRPLYDRTQRLMAYERARQAFYRLPWTIYADSHTLDWLGNLDVRPHSVVPWDESVSSLEGPGKILLLVQAVSLPAVARLNLAPKVALAAWFGSNPIVPYQYGPEVQQLAPLCFAPDEAVAGGLALVSNTVLQGAPGKALLDLSLKYANSHVFYETTRPEAQRQRPLPDVYQPGTQRLRILMQLARSMPGEETQEVLNLAGTLKQQGFEVFVLMLGQESARATQGYHGEIPVLTLPARERERHYRLLLVDKRIELVQAYDFTFGADVAGELQIPFVQTLHTSFAQLSRKQIAAYRRSDAYTTAYLCTSHQVAREAVQRLGLPAGKLLMLPGEIAIPVLGAHQVPYKRLFQWLVQGGTPAGARPWFRRPRKGQTTLALRPAAQAA